MAKHTVDDQMKSISDSDMRRLYDELDILWMQYLDCADQYQAAMTGLSKHMSNGYFALAKANMRTSDRRRFGRDYYDERMRSMKPIVIQAQAEGQYRLHMEPAPPVNTGADTDEKSKAETVAMVQQPSPPATPPPEEHVSSVGDKQPEKRPESTHLTETRPDESTEDPGKKSSPPMRADPLRWFGILVPQELRSAQASFTTSVTEHMLQAVNMSREMRRMESAIENARHSVDEAEKSIDRSTKTVT